jgi:hypothetical protein
MIAGFFSLATTQRLPNIVKISAAMTTTTNAKTAPRIDKNKTFQAWKDKKFKEPVFRPGLVGVFPEEALGHFLAIPRMSTPPVHLSPGARR